MLYCFTPWIHQKTIEFSDFFRGYRNAALGWNGLYIVTHKFDFPYTAIVPRQGSLYFFSSSRTSKTVKDAFHRQCIPTRKGFFFVDQSSFVTLWALHRNSYIFVFRKIWRALFSRNTHFEIRPFVLLPTNFLVGLTELYSEGYQTSKMESF